jgi:hypothetical protein
VLFDSVKSAEPPIKLTICLLNNESEFSLDFRFANFVSSFAYFVLKFTIYFFIASSKFLSKNLLY